MDTIGPHHSLKGKVIVVTGGGKRLGRFLAEFFSERGAQVAICGRSSEHLEETRLAIKNGGWKVPLACALDVADAKAVAGFAESVGREFARCDVLVNNAAGWLQGQFLDVSRPDVDKVIDSIVKGPIFTCQSFWPLLKKAAPGHVVNITTLGALPMRSNASPVYVAAKAGLAGFTDALRRYAVNDGIRVLEILPGSLAPHPAQGPSSGVPSIDIAEAILFAITRGSAGMVEEIRLPAFADWLEDYARYENKEQGQEG